MMAFTDMPWIKHYDEGVPASLEPYPAQPLFRFLQDAAQKAPNKTATLTSVHLPLFGRRKAELSYGALESQSDALASALLSLGLKKGDRVAIVLPNCAQFVIAFWAVLKAGGTVAATNPTYPSAKMSAQIKDSGATFVICLSLFYEMIKKFQAETDVQQVIVTNIKDYFPPLAATLFTIAREKKEGHRIERRPGDHDFASLIQAYQGRKVNDDMKATDTAIFQYTGGTTGVPKAAMATHQALVANVMQGGAWLGEHLSPETIFMGAIPFFHVYGLVTVVATAARLAAKILLVINPRETVEVLEIIKNYKPTIFHGVPAMYNAINVHPDVKAGKYDLSSIGACISGSAPLSASTKHTFEKLTGGLLVEGYGMSEMPTVTHVNPLHGEIREGSIGLPFPDMEIRIVSLTDGVTDVGVGEVGELVMRGPQMMTGYWNLPAETQVALRQGPDGKVWLYSGDIARMDSDGYFYIVDRKKDMALIGGFNVYPNNVEAVLSGHPAVQEVAVAAIPHPDADKAGQEALKAWVILKEGQHISEQELIAYMEQKLARYEVPTRITFVRDFPRSTVGKVLRRELVQMEFTASEKPS